MNIVGCDFHPGWQQIVVLDPETGEVKSIKFNISNYLGNTGVKPSLPLTYVGIVSGQAAEGTRVGTRILKALKVNKAAQKVNFERQRARFVDAIYAISR